MCLLVLGIVKMFRGCSVPHIQQRLKENGYAFKLSVVAEVLKQVYLRIEYEDDYNEKVVV